MTAGQIAALIAAGAFVVLVLLLAVPLLKLGRTLDEATIAIRKAHEGSAPLARRRADHPAPGQHPARARRRHHLQRAHRHEQRVRAHLAVHRHARRSARSAAAFSYGLNKAIKARRGVKNAGKPSPSRPPEARRMKRLFWLGRRRRRGRLRRPPRPGRRAEPHPRRASAPTSPTGCASSARGSARSGPRCARAWPSASTSSPRWSSAAPATTCPPIGEALADPVPTARARRAGA